MSQLTPFRGRAESNNDLRKQGPLNEIFSFSFMPCCLVVYNPVALPRFKPYQRHSSPNLVSEGYAMGLHHSNHSDCTAKNALPWWSLYTPPMTSRTYFVMYIFYIHIPFCQSNPFYTSQSAHTSNFKTQSYKWPGHIAKHSAVFHARLSIALFVAPPAFPERNAHTVESLFLLVKWPWLFLPNPGHLG